MARRTRFSSSTVKEEAVDGEKSIHNEPIPRQSEASNCRSPSLIRGAQEGSATATAIPRSGNPVSTSRFFPPSSSALRGQKRKATGHLALPRDSRSLRASVETGNEAQIVSERAAVLHSTKWSTGELAVPTAVDPRRRRSSRLSAVKMEESARSVKLEKHSCSAVSASHDAAESVSEAATEITSMRGDKIPPGRRAAVARVGVKTSQHTEKKLGRKVGKALGHIKTEAHTGPGGPRAKEHGGKTVSPRLAEKAALIVQVMDKLYPNPPIPINHVDSFTLLCGVLLSAQTTDAQVNLVTKELFRVAPNPRALSEMTHNELQRIIRSVGLAPTKAKHLIALSQQLLERFDGQVPRTFEGLQSLPGVGRKTAAVVMVQAFNTPAFPVDTHIHRLALRWGLTKNEKNASKVEQELMAIFPRDSWAKLHLQFIYFGREHCQARLHDAVACPICCWVRKTGPSSPQTMSELTCLNDYLASPTPPKKSSKNAIVYSERILEMEQFRMKLEDK